jgi:hypothetical protein
MFTGSDVYKFGIHFTTWRDCVSSRYSRHTRAAWFSVHATLAAETMIFVFSEFRK